MTDITITIPLALTTSQIVRANPAAISESEARQLALELHDLVAEVQARYARHPLPEGKLSDDEAAFELADLVDAVRRTALGFWPYSQDAAGTESCWLMEQLTHIEDALYDRYLRLHDQSRRRTSRNCRPDRTNSKALGSHALRARRGIEAIEDPRRALAHGRFQS